MYSVSHIGLIVVLIKTYYYADDGFLEHIWYSKKQFSAHPNPTMVMDRISATASAKWTEDFHIKPTQHSTNTM